MCWTCRRPSSVCCCGDIRRLPSRTKVIFLQHPAEARVGVSTGRMAHLSLPNSHFFVGLTATGHDELEQLCSGEGVALLFPSPSATDVKDVTVPVRTLVVVDGTWSTAKKIVERCPLLSALPRLRFTPPRPGNYRIRKEPALHCLATIEATAMVLDELEGPPGKFAAMIKTMDAMVDRQLDYLVRVGDSRHRRHRLARA